MDHTSMRITSCLAVFIISFFHASQPADLNTIINSQEFIRYFVLNEPGGENSTPYAWRTGLSLKDLETIHYVNKEWLAACEKIIDKPRNEIVKKYRGCFKLSKNSILFNKFGEWCGVALDTYDDCSIVWGHPEVEIPTRSILPRLAMRGSNMRSFALDYHTADGNEAHDDVFHLESTHWYQRKYNRKINVIMLPTNKEAYVLSFIDPLNLNIGSLGHTFPLIVQKAFNQSSNPKFWFSERFKEDGISVQRESGHEVTLEINLGHSAFRSLIGNALLLHNTKTHFQDTICSCSSQKIDPECLNHYKKFCSLLVEENIQLYDGSLTAYFARYHILHEIKDAVYDTDMRTNSVQFYANYFGEVIAKKKDCKKEILYAVNWDTNALQSELDFAKLYTYASNRAAEWFRKGSFLFTIQQSNREKRIQLPDTFFDPFFGSTPLVNKRIYLKPQETVADFNGLTTEMGNPYYIFSLHTTTLNTDGRLLFLNPVSIVDNPYNYESTNAETIKNGFNFIFNESYPDLPTFGVIAPRDAIVQALDYICTTNPIAKFTGFIDKDYPFKEWNTIKEQDQKADLVQFLISESHKKSHKKIIFPNTFFIDNFAKYKLRRNEFLIGTTETVLDTQLLPIQKDGGQILMILLHTYVNFANSHQLYFLNTGGGENEPDHGFTCHDSAELNNVFNVILNKAHEHYSCYIRASQEVISQFIKNVRSAPKSEEPEKKITFKSLAGFKSTTPLTSYDCNHRDNCTHHLLKDDTVYIKPTSIVDKSMYGTSQQENVAFRKSSFDRFLCGCSSIGAFCGATTLGYYLGSGILTARLNNNLLLPFTFPLITYLVSSGISGENNTKIVWPARFATLAGFIWAGKFFFTSLVPQLAYGALPLLYLGLHIYRVNRDANRPTSMKLSELYNSWPAQFHRILRKIAPPLYPLGNNAQ